MKTRAIRATMIEVMRMLQVNNIRKYTVLSTRGILLDSADTAASCSISVLSKLEV